MSSPFAQIARRIAQARQAAPVEIELPGIFLWGLPPGLEGFAYHAEPGRGRRALALGEAWREEARGEERLSRLVEGLARRGPMGAPLWFAAPADPRRPARVWLPVLQLEATQGRCRLWVAGDHWHEPLGALLNALHREPESAPCSQDIEERRSRPARTTWCRIAAEALAEIRRGTLEKLVLARELEVHGQRPFDAARLARVLECRFPGLHQIALDLGGEHLLAATPEHLLSLCGRTLACEALAGTAARDPDPARDARLGRQLLGDAKIRHEHRLVVEALERALHPWCASLEIPEAPRLMRLRGLQHLHTPVSGRLETPVHALDLAAALHPSPAVAGWPRPSALAWLKAHEGLERGWYTGLLGRLMPGGDAQIEVILRAIRISGRSAWLNAGAGLVVGSNPQAEWEETELKLSGLLEALAEA